MEELRLDDLIATLDRSAPGVLRIRLTGKSASPDASAALAPLFERATAAGATEGRAVALHFERLEYFNSSTIAALVQFIRTAHEAGLALTVVYDPRLRWQAVSFDALRRALGRLEGGAGVRFLEG